MAINPPEGFTEYQDGETVELEPGDELQGVVLGIQSGETENGRWYRMSIKVEDGKEVEYFAKGDAKRALQNEDVETADEVWIGVEEESQTFTDEDGEEREYYPHRFALKEQ